MILKYFTIFNLFIISCTTPSFQLHINRSYFSSDNQYFDGKKNTLSLTNQDSIITVIGIYSHQDLFIEKYPIINCFSQQHGFYSLPLTGHIDCANDVLLELSGKIVIYEKKYPVINKTTKFRLLSVTSYKIICDPNFIKNKVNQQYQKIREELQQKITPEGSKLQLTSHPDWKIWYLEAEQKFIFAWHQHDLMYAADIEFIVKATSEKITDVFAREWFKGE